jgi:hypothetical protein
MGKTLNVKFGIHVCQMTNFRGVLDNCPTIFYHPIIIIIIIIIIYSHIKTTLY